MITEEEYKRFENHKDLFNIRDDFLAVEMRKLLKVFRELKGGIKK